MTNKSEFEIRLERSGVTNPALVNLAKEAYELGLAVQQARVDELETALWRIAANVHTAPAMANIALTAVDKAKEAT